MEAEKEEKRFTISDKRFSSKTQQEKTAEDQKIAEEREKDKAGFTHREKEREALREMDFSAFLMSLSTSALMHLGDFEDPVSRERKVDLPLAKQTIDILGLLKDKTKGNLTSDEENLLDNLLYNLRMKFVEVARRQSPKA